LPDFEARESGSGTAGQDFLGRAVVHNCDTAGIMDTALD